MSESQRSGAEADELEQLRREAAFLRDQLQAAGGGPAADARLVREACRLIVKRVEAEERAARTFLCEAEAL